MDNQQIQSATGRTLYGSDGEKIGTIAQVYLDDVTGEPAWVTVATGLLGGKESFVPVAQAQLGDDGLRVAYDKASVKGAPSVAADGHLSPEEEAELYRHYGLDYTLDTSDQSGTRGTGHDTSGRTTDAAMTRSEERLHVATEKVATGRARLRKFVVTEEQTITVPVTREEVRLVHEPITDADQVDVPAGTSFSEEQHEVVLTEERVVVSKETVPVERVRLATETVTEQQQVTEQVRKEQIETEGDVDVRPSSVGTDRR